MIDIVDYIDAEFSRMQKLVTKMQKSIKLLNLRRTSLIESTITGKTTFIV